MRTSDAEISFDKAPGLTLDDILLTNDESTDFQNYLQFTLLRIIIAHGGPSFEKFKVALELHQPYSEEKIEVHKTELYNLPAFHIDKSTITGNAEVVKAITDELELTDKPNFMDYVRIFAGDQLSIARLRALVNIRAGQEAGYSGFSWGIYIPGLFHAKMADIHGFFVTHWGRASPSSPSSLAWHNNVLNRNPISLSSLPPFRACRDLVFVSLYARVLHCLLKVSGEILLTDYAKKVDDFQILKQHAAEIMSRFASSRVVGRMRRARAEGRPEEGDVHFENGALFIRDALVSREFTNAVKCGDSGRVVLVLKTLALAYRGNGRTKYGYEMLHLIHNLKHVWPKPLRYVASP